MLPEREKKRRPADRVPRIAGRRQPTKAQVDSWARKGPDVGPQTRLDSWRPTRSSQPHRRQGDCTVAAPEQSRVVDSQSGLSEIGPADSTRGRTRQAAVGEISPRQRQSPQRPGRMDDDSFTFTRSALETLQIAAEGFLVELMEDGAAVATHCRRRTLMLKDVTFLRYIKKDPSLQPKLQLLEFNETNALSDVMVLSAVRMTLT